MSNHKRRVLITSILSAWGVLGCAHNPGHEQFDSCAAGMTCSLEGKLHLYPGEPAGVALLSSGEECAKLALPDDFYVDPLRKKWNGKKVKVVGRAFLQPGIDSGGDGVLMWYAEQDRRLALGMCDGGMGIYVTSLETSGEVWP